MRLPYVPRSLPAGFSAASLAGLLLFPACGSDSSTQPDAAVPTSVEVRAGQGQNAPVTAALPSPLEVRVLNVNGQPVPDIAVSWSTAEENGTIAPSGAAATDSQGIARAVWTMGTRSGAVQATASLQAFPATVGATFVARADAGPPVQLDIVSGSGQEVVSGGAFPEPVVVQLRDEYGNPAGDRVIQATVEEGDGWLLDAEPRTDDEGRAEVVWYAGFDPTASQRLRVESGSLTGTAEGVAFAPVPGTAYLGHRGFVEYIPGTLPFVVTAPHGGRLAPDDIPDRTTGTTVTDADTDDAALRLASALEDRVGARPHLVVLHLRRTKLDGNREIVEAAQGNAQAERAWHEFHRWTELALAEVEATHGTGFYLDLHGHGKHQAFELGYLLTGTDLEQDDEWLDGSEAIEKSSLTTLGASSAYPFSRLIRGDVSLGALFEEEAYTVIPGPGQAAPTGPFFSGGYNTQRHGCRGGGPICGYQLELNRIGVRDSAANRQLFAEAHARVMERFFDLHFGIDLGQAGQRLQGSSLAGTSTPR